MLAILRRPTVPVVALLSTVLAILLGTTAPASAAGVAENRVGDISHTVEPLVGPPQHITAGQRLGEAAPRAVFVLATGVAAKAGPGKALEPSRWPANSGFLGDPVETTLKAGTRVDRFGGPGGTFASPEGTPFGARSLRSTSATAEYNVYEVAQPVTVRGGTVAPAFGYGGGGVQYQFNSPIADLLEQGILKRVGQ